jgi:hypothetical protein
MPSRSRSSCSTTDVVELTVRSVIVAETSSLARRSTSISLLHALDGLVRSAGGGCCDLAAKTVSSSEILAGQLLDHGRCGFGHGIADLAGTGFGRGQAVFHKAGVGAHHRVDLAGLLFHIGIGQLDQLLAALLDIGIDLLVGRLQGVDGFDQFVALVVEAGGDARDVGQHIGGGLLQQGHLGGNPRIGGCRRHRRRFRPRRGTR